MGEWSMVRVLGVVLAMVGTMPAGVAGSEWSLPDEHHLPQCAWRYHYGLQGPETAILIVVVAIGGVLGTLVRVWYRRHWVKVKTSLQTRILGRANDDEDGANPEPPHASGGAAGAAASAPPAVELAKTPQNEESALASAGGSAFDVPAFSPTLVQTPPAPPAAHAPQYPPPQQGYYPPPQQGYYPPPQQGYYPPQQQPYYPQQQQPFHPQQQQPYHPQQQQPYYPQQQQQQVYAPPLAPKMADKITTDAPEAYHATTPLEFMIVACASRRINSCGYLKRVKEEHTGLFGILLAGKDENFTRSERTAVYVVVCSMMLLSTGFLTVYETAYLNKCFAHEDCYDHVCGVPQSGITVRTCTPLWKDDGTADSFRIEDTPDAREDVRKNCNKCLCYASAANATVASPLAMDSSIGANTTDGTITCAGYLDAPAQCKFDAFVWGHVGGILIGATIEDAIVKLFQGMLRERADVSPWRNSLAAVLMGECVCVFIALAFMLFTPNALGLLTALGVFLLTDPFLQLAKMQVWNIWLDRRYYEHYVRPKQDGTWSRLLANVGWFFSLLWIVGLCSSTLRRRTFKVRRFGTCWGFAVLGLLIGLSTGYFNK